MLRNHARSTYDEQVAKISYKLQDELTPNKLLRNHTRWTYAEQVAIKNNTSYKINLRRTSCKEIIQDQLTLNKLLRNHTRSTFAEVSQTALRLIMPRCNMTSLLSIWDFHYVNYISFFLMTKSSCLFTYHVK